MVGNDEILYRRVPARPECVAETDGQRIVSASAFNDRGRKPSVDRANLCGNNPSSCKNDEADGVAFLVTEHVRRIDSVRRPPPEQAFYRVDVVARPIPANSERGLRENPAHAQVESDPAMESDARFRKLKEALARLARWIVEPVFRES